MSNSNQKPERRKLGRYTIFESVYGELQDRPVDGVIEQIFTPPTGGKFVKLLGCNYLFKGNSPQANINGIGLAKANFSYVPRIIIGKSIVLTSALAFLFLFARKHFWNIADKWVTITRRRALVEPGIMLPENEHNRVTHALAYAIGMALTKEFPTLPQDISLADLEPYETFKKGRGLQLSSLIAKLIQLLSFFLETDAAYRFPLQDGLENVDKENARRRPIHEVRRLFDIVITREARTCIDAKGETIIVEQHKKWIFIKAAVSVVLMLSPQLRRIARTFLLELVIEDVKLDIHDWYFCLWRWYNYRGWTLEQRIEERERMDKEAGNKPPKVGWAIDPELGKIAVLSE